MAIRFSHARLAPFNVHHKVKSTGFQPVSFSRADSWPRLCRSHRRSRQGLPSAGSGAGGLPVPCDPREPTYFSRWLFSVHHKVKSTGFQPVSFSRADSWPRLCRSHRRSRQGLPSAGSGAGGLPVPCDPREPTYFSRWLFSKSAGRDFAPAPQLQFLSSEQFACLHRGKWVEGSRRKLPITAASWLDGTRLRSRGSTRCPRSGRQRASSAER